MRTGSIVVLIIAALFFTVLHSILAGVFLRDVIEVHQAQSWPKVDGRVVRSDVTTSKGSKGRTNYRAVVEYEYEVQGRQYRSTRIHGTMTESSNRSSEAQATVKRYPVGARVSVYAKPARSETALLEPGISDSDRSGLVLAAGATLGVFGLWSIVGFFIAARLNKRGEYLAGMRILRPAGQGVSMPRFGGGPEPAITGILRVRKAGIGWVASSLFVGAGVGCVLGLIGLITDGYSEVVMWGFIGLIVVATGVCTVIFRKRWVSELKSDLVLDVDKEELTMPKLPDSAGAIAAYESVGGVRISKVKRRAGKHNVTNYDVRVEDLNGSSFGTAAIFHTEKDAQKFAAWLEGQLGLVVA